MIRLFHDAHYDFLGWRRKAFVLSAVVTALLVAVALYWQFTRGSWLNYGVDFLGGTMVQITIDEPTDAGVIRGVLDDVVPNAQVANFGSDAEFLIRTPASTEGERPASDIVTQALNEHYGTGQVRIDRIETVGPKVGAELQRHAAIALILSFIATLVYLAFRFQWRYGVAALIATMHDVLLTLLLISALQLEVSLVTVAAVLTIVGYSLNDTIVIFDRIRENRKTLARRMGRFDLMNRSVNETLARTVITGGSTLLALLSLFFLGGEVIREFALILILGILIGTYSSIMIGAAALYEIEERAGEHPEETPRPSRQTVGAGV
ncbi:MAG TPA: protein translocase subunit SecF [Longimicrobiales bacterium]